MTPVNGDTRVDLACSASGGSSSSLCGRHTWINVRPVMPYPSNLVYNVTLDGKFYRNRMTREQIEVFLENYEIIASKNRGAAGTVHVIRAKKTCANCQYWNRKSLYGGTCDSSLIRAIRTRDQQDYFYAGSPSSLYGSDCNYHSYYRKDLSWLQITQKKR